MGAKRASVGDAVATLINKDEEVWQQHNQNPCLGSSKDIGRLSCRP
jgi:hypothetical protein